MYQIICALRVLYFYLIYFIFNIIYFLFNLYFCTIFSALLFLCIMQPHVSEVVLCEMSYMCLLDDVNEFCTPMFLYIISI